MYAMNAKHSTQSHMQLLGNYTVRPKNHLFLTAIVVRQRANSRLGGINSFIFPLVYTLCNVHTIDLHVSQKIMLIFFYLYCI